MHRCSVFALALAVSVCSGFMDDDSQTTVELCNKSGQCNKASIQSSAGSYVCFKEGSEKKSWYKAKEECAKKGGRLAEVHDTPTLDFLVKNKDIVTNYIWLGASDEASEGAWKWVSGSGLTVDNWNVGEPDNLRDKQDCVFMYRGDGGWRDFSCNANNIYPFCESTTQVDCKTW